MFTTIFWVIFIILVLNIAYVLIKQYQPHIHIYRLYTKNFCIEINWYHYYNKCNKMGDYIWYRKRKSYRIVF